jgi:hypothetical protein
MRAYGHERLSQEPALQFRERWWFGEGLATGGVLASAFKPADDLPSIPAGRASTSEPDSVGARARRAVAQPRHERSWWNNV